MDRKRWLATIYREANLFIERHANEEGRLTPTEVEEYEPELHEQIQETLKNVDYLEDIVKHSLLKNPPPDLWYGESNWQHVLIGVAAACLVHDVKGITLKILDGDLPKADANSIVDPPDEEMI